MRLGKIASAFFCVNIMLWSVAVITLVGCCAKKVPPIPPPIHKNQNPHPYQAYTHISIEPIPNPEMEEKMGEHFYEYALSHFYAKGTGVVIENIGDSRILTAGHVCSDPSADSSELFNGYNVSVYDWLGNRHSAEIIAIDESADLCLLEVEDTEFPANVKIASRMPTRGDELFLTACPLGIFIGEAPMMWDGYFSGVDGNGFYVMTVPVAPGSSGGGVVNQHGELISIVVAGIVGFDEISLGSSLEMIKDFLEENE